jgi:hypothetical protein
MSIAVSVVVKPSRLFFGLCAGLCCACALLGCAVFLGAVPALSRSMSFAAGLFCVAAAVYGLRSAWRSRQAWGLDISGTGQIRLHRAANIEQRPSSDTENCSPPDGLLVILLPDSTMWPRFLLLRLQDGEGAVHHVAILSDSVPSEAFRAVSVACRWIAAHRFRD